MSSNQELRLIKSKLKKWEKEFKTTNGRDPNKSDIKLNPEIAKLYSTYNTNKSTNSSKPSTSSIQLTPSKPKSIQFIHHSSYQNPNSPIKLQQLLLLNSTKKKSNSQNNLKNNQVNSNSTPNRNNPFESNSGGGKGSPDLFADLLLQTKDTPRTKARKYLIGVGSPLKPKPHLNQSDSATIKNSTGLSTFLKSRIDESQSKPNQVQVEENIEIEANQDSDEILGPSPFKPKPTGQVPFRCLFNDQEAEESNQNSQSPVKSNLINKLNIKSNIPFIPNNSQNQIETLNDFPGCGQIDLQKQIDQNRLPLGVKRKRMKPGEEDESFYEDINNPDLNGLSTINKKVIRNNTKRTKVERTNSNLIKSKTNQSQLNMSTRLPNKKSKELRDYDESDSEEEKEGLVKMPDLPFGAQSQTSVITELETFTFEPTDHNSKQTSTIPQVIHSKPKLNQSKKSNWKGKGKATTPPLSIEEEIKQIKVTGTQKVIVRAYKPVNEIQMKKLRKMNIFEEDETNLIESLGPLNDEAVSSEGEEEETLEERNHQNDLKEKEEGDLIVSEEVLNLLNLDEHSGFDRQLIKREKVREKKVKSVLEGFNLNPIKQIKVNQVISKNVKPNKNSFKIKSQRVGGSSNLKNRRESSVDLETEVYEFSEHDDDDDEDDDEDDDWEEDPEGWKEVDGNDGLYTDDYEL